MALCRTRFGLSVCVALGAAAPSYAQEAATPQMLEKTMQEGTKLLALPEELQAACGRYFSTVRDQPGYLIFQIMIVVQKGWGSRSFFAIRRDAFKFTLDDARSVPFVRYAGAGDNGVYEISISSQDFQRAKCLTVLRDQ